jgi:hypothetical protein
MDTQFLPMSAAISRLTLLPCPLSRWRRGRNARREERIPPGAGSGAAAGALMGNREASRVGFLGGDRIRLLKATGE